MMTFSLPNMPPFAFCNGSGIAAPTITICYTGILNDPVPQDYTRDIPDI